LFWPLPASLIKLRRHGSNHRVNRLLDRVETVIHNIQSGKITPELRAPSSRGLLETQGRIVGNEDKVYANSYVNLGDMEVIGFDYDYTLVSYTPELLYLIYDMARNVLVDEFKYPNKTMQGLPGYDPDFAVRGLAVDLQTACICHLTSTYRVSEAFFGRERVDKDAIRVMYTSKTGGGYISPEERRKRLRPLNDIFSMVEACLLADVVQIFKDRGIPFDARSVVNDVLKAVGNVHTSKAMHRAVSADLEKFVEPDSKQHLRGMLTKFSASGKKMMLVSNSEFWYVDAGMRYVVGEDWRNFFDVVIAPAGKPAFYTQSRPFREVSVRTGRVKFKPITSLEPDEVYCDGSITELMKLTGWGFDEGSGTFDGSRILYLGDSLFADLVDARRLYGWVTAAIVREIRHEARVQNSMHWVRSRHIMHALLHCVRLSQEEMGVDLKPGEPNLKRQEPRSEEDKMVLDHLEKLIEKWRTICESCISPTFGSIFRTPLAFGSTQSLFSQCMRRHADLYSSRVENFRLYSTDHRFYPNDVRMGNPHEAEPFQDTVLDLLSLQTLEELPEVR